jgi:hypothetical protein
VETVNAAVTRAYGVDRIGNLQAGDHLDALLSVEAAPRAPDCGAPVFAVCVELGCPIESACFILTVPKAGRPRQISELLILLPLRTFGFIASGMEDELSMVEDTLHRIILRRGASLK